MSNSQVVKTMRKHVWQGFKDVGVLNGIPAVPVHDEYTPYRSRDNTPITCIRGKDGTENWRLVGLGSV